MLQGFHLLMKNKITTTDLISIGNIRILYMIFVCKFKELEAEARFRE